ncbi:type I-E CRISPR-associated protein Cas5/CasD [candidate division KSB1 bacterium]|nr:type I-E CRISPR-associated protein Cas5/CasD [candidate division KSB1 bacterium]
MSSAVLLMRLRGPMQSWGTQSRFSVRDSDREPSKSGVIGMICCALGRDINKSLKDLNDLRMGIRADKEGKIELDFHTVGGAPSDEDGKPESVYRASGKEVREPAVSKRYYLADAEFLVGLEGDTEFLKKIHHAVANPKWPLFLGRKAFVPSLPVHIPDGLIEGKSLLKVLKEYPLRIKTSEQRNIRIVLETDDPNHETRNDVPVSFEKRRFSTRQIKNLFITKSQIGGG